MNDAGRFNLLKVTRIQTARRLRVRAWPLILLRVVLLGAAAGALLATPGAAARVERSKLGLASGWEPRVRVRGRSVYRTTIRGSPEEVRSCARALDRSWRWPLAGAFALDAGAGVGAWPRTEGANCHRAPSLGGSRGRQRQGRRTRGEPNPTSCVRHTDEKA
jgi:hypothetical protein